MNAVAEQASSLFRHVSAEKSAHYRAIMTVFADAERQFRLHLRPDEVQGLACWPEAVVPAIEVVQQMLGQLEDWGNLIAQPDTARVSSIEDFYRARFLYRLSHGGEAVERAMERFAEALNRRGELQSVALEDILGRLQTLSQLAAEAEPDAAKIHEALRDLVQRFADLADNAQAFMAGLARTVDLQRAEVSEVLRYKDRLLGYLERFIGDLVSRSGRIAQLLLDLHPQADALIAAAAHREARDAAPDDAEAEADAFALRLKAWRERWQGLSRWFIGDERSPAQSELLRARARAAIPALLNVITTVNERRAGKSDRSADYRQLARWFAECEDESAAQRLHRAAFALNSARHLALKVEAEVPPSTPWAKAGAVAISPRLRERASLTVRGPAAKVQDRSRDRQLLAARIADERVQTEAALARLATGAPPPLSQLGWLKRPEFRLLLSVIGEALATQTGPDADIERLSSDGSLRISLKPLPGMAVIDTEDGQLRGRDHLLTIHRTGA